MPSCDSDEASGSRVARQGGVVRSDWSLAICLCAFSREMCAFPHCAGVDLLLRRVMFDEVRRDKGGLGAPWGAEMTNSLRLLI